MSDDIAVGEVAVQIVTTFEEKSDAEAMAQRLITARLAACVQIDGPIESFYRWEGAVEQATEWRLTIKTMRTAIAQTIAVVRREHPYDEPEVLVVPVSGGSASYLRWLLAEVQPRVEAAE